MLSATQYFLPEYKLYVEFHFVEQNMRDTVFSPHSFTSPFPSFIYLLFSLFSDLLGPNAIKDYISRQYRHFYSIVGWRNVVSWIMRARFKENEECGSVWEIISVWQRKQRKEFADTSQNRELQDNRKFLNKIVIV